jgi:hypothetical protein
MAYEPVSPYAKGPNISVEDDAAMSTRYDAGLYSSNPDDSRDRDTEDGAEDVKRTSHGMQRQMWPSHAQRVAVMTPLKVLIMVFDVILASTPIMFLGESHQS